MILLDNFQSRFGGTFLFYAKSRSELKFRDGGAPTGTRRPYALQRLGRATTLRDLRNALAAWKVAERVPQAPTNG